jgi:hypothetical protein
VDGNRKPREQLVFAGEGELDGAPRDLADVRLEVRVAADDLHLSAPAAEADGQHPRGVHDLPWGIDGQMANRVRAVVLLAEALHASEIQVVVQRVGLLDELFGGHAVTSRPKLGLRFSRKALIPSFASAVAISSSR